MVSLLWHKKTKAKIVLVEIKPTKFWQLNSWDKFVIPKPFGILNYYATSEIDVSEMKLEDRDNLANYKVPKQLHFIDELSKNATGKVLKRELKVNLLNLES
jgi:Acyl-CoA synthetases (AMP-forming)/AMP-acid ligases II